MKAASKTTMELVAEHKADQRHHVVSAASILAKVRRDASMRELEEAMHCKIGSGYPHDQDTIKFFERMGEGKPASFRHAPGIAGRRRSV